MEKQQVFYIHGGESYSNYDDYLADLKNQPLRSPSDEDSVKKWPHTLRTALGEGYQVFMPSFPNSNNSQYDEWKIWLEKHFEYLTDDIVLVCWSQGGMFIAKYLSENEVPFTIKSLILLAAPFDYFVCEGSKEDGGDFYPVAENVPKIQEKTQNITIMHSKDDFVVPYEHALKYKAALPEAELVTFEDKNHFLVEELPELVERIQSLT
jgi:predicted alpha/beta hydrolase family esterase